MSNDNALGWILLGYIIGAVIVLILTSILNGPINLEQNVADDICLHLTNQTSVASVEDGKFVCETPSFDDTTYIVVRKTGTGS